MSDYNWEEIRLFSKAMEGLEAIEKLTGEKPAISMVIVTKPAREKWRATLEQYGKFYELPINERIEIAGLSKKPIKELDKPDFKEKL